MTTLKAWDRPWHYWIFSLTPFKTRLTLIWDLVVNMQVSGHNQTDYQNTVSVPFRPKAAAFSLHWWSNAMPSSSLGSYQVEKSASTHLRDSKLLTHLIARPGTERQSSEAVKACVGQLYPFPRLPLALGFRTRPSRRIAQLHYSYSLNPWWDDTRNLYITKPEDFMKAPPRMGKACILETELDLKPSVHLYIELNRPKLMLFVCHFSWLNRTCTAGDG